MEYWSLIRISMTSELPQIVAGGGCMLDFPPFLELFAVTYADFSPKVGGDTRSQSTLSVTFNSTLWLYG